MADDRLRRLLIKETNFSRRLVRPGSPFRSDRVHPYRYIHEPRDGPRFRVCLHSTFLQRGPAEAAVAFRLLVELPEEYFELFRTPGATDPAYDNVPAFTLDEASDIRATVLKAFGHEVHSGVILPQQWYGIAEKLVGERKAGDRLIEYQAASELGAHVFVTNDTVLLTYRDKARLNETAIVSPLESLPLLWSWMRGFGDYWEGHTVSSTSHYYWALARTLTPNGWPGFGALVRGEYAIPNGEELVSLGQSALTRLSNAVESVDNLYRLWQLPTDNTVIDRMSDEFDRIVLGIAAILDNLALLAVEYFNLKGLQPHQRALTGTRFVYKLRANGDPRAAALADYIDASRPSLLLHVELRHHAIHRTKLVGIRYQREQEPQQTRIRIMEPTLGTVWDQLIAMGEVPSEWGISDRSDPHDVPVSFLGESGRTETRHSPGEALLDPMAFGRRLVARTARVVNDVFGTLSFESDATLVGGSEAGLGAPAGGIEDWPLREVDRDALVLTSPLTGLV